MEPLAEGKLTLDQLARFLERLPTADERLVSALPRARTLPCWTSGRATS